MLDNDRGAQLDAPIEYLEYPLLPFLSSGSHRANAIRRRPALRTKPARPTDRSMEQKQRSAIRISSSFQKDTMPVNLPTTLLRSFVAIVDTGSMLNAAEQVYVTQSALSLQIKRLEELVQQPLFTREGRRLALTQAGDVLLDYSRRVLNLHDEALAAIRVGNFAGPVRVGMVQDFAESLLRGLLARFSELHPESQIFARVAGTAELLTMLDRGQLDIIIGYAAADDPAAVKVAPMAWYGDSTLAERDVVPLAVLEMPCRFR